MEHQLQAYPLAEPVIHRKLPLTLDHRKVMKEKVFEWMREGMFRRVQHPGWVANAVPIKQRNGTWQMQIDYTSLNKVCAKDMYPFSKMEEEIGSLIGYKYKCFLQLPKEHSQVQMLESDDEKTRFHIEEGVYYFTYMPKGLKNSERAKCRSVPRGNSCKKQDRAKLNQIHRRNVGQTPKVELRTYHISYVQRKEVDGQVVKKFFEQGEQVLRVSDKNNERASGLKEKPQEELVPDHTSSQSLNRKAEALTGLASIILEFLNQEVSVGVKTRPSVEAAGRSPKEARKVAKKATTGKLSPTWEDQSGSN
nr:hypothetical protein [Tanacetum cinerariifolium]